MHHGEYLRAITRDDLLVYHLARDHTRANLDAADRAMLDYARKLNDRPHDMTEADLEGLRAAGFDDRACLDIVMVASAFNLLNRWADAFAVPPEPRFVQARERGDARAEALLRERDTAAGT